MASLVFGLANRRITDGDEAERAGGFWQTDGDRQRVEASCGTPEPVSPTRGLALSLLRLASLDNGVLKGLVDMNQHSRAKSYDSFFDKTSEVPLVARSVTSIRSNTQRL
jgi:hypothetical protein